MRGLVAISLVLAACGDEATPSESTGGVVETDGEVTADLSSGSSTSSSTSSPSSSGDGEEDSSDADSSPPPDVPTFVPYSAVQAIFDEHCVAGCHEPTGGYPSLDLSGYARNELILVASNGSSLFYVVTSDAENSYLWHKVNGSQGAVGGMGSTMPRGAPQLDQEDIDSIAHWIDSGAPP